MQDAPSATWRERRVLVTGASGFLGTAVCRALAAAGTELHGTGRTRPVPPLARAWTTTTPAEHGRLVRALRPQLVIHLASPVDPTRDPALYPALRPGILDLTVELATACGETGARLVQIGTCEELAGGEVPFSPRHAPQPTSPYSALKAAGTAWVLAQHHAHGLDVVVLRPFRAYGPGEARGLVPEACRAALAGRPLPMTDGAQVREWNHVDAIAAGIVRAAAHPGATGRCLNLGGGPRLAVRDLVARIYALAQADPALVQVGALPRRPGEVDRFWGDHADTEALIGPLPHPPLDQGLRQTLAWYRQEAR